MRTCIFCGSTCNVRGLVLSCDHVKEFVELYPEVDLDDQLARFGVCRCCISRPDALRNPFTVTADGVPSNSSRRMLH
jgi:hypothetical protein